MIDEGNGRARVLFSLPRLLSSPFPSVSCFFAATLLPEVAFGPASSTRKLLSRGQPGALPILVSRTLFTLPDRALGIPFERGLHQAPPLVHNKGSAPGAASTDSTEFQWLQSQIELLVRVCFILTVSIDFPVIRLPSRCFTLKCVKR